jgi:hypothetical protein
VALSQEVPFSANAVGRGLLPDQPPLKPNEVDPPVPSDPLYATLVAVTAAPDWVTAAFQAWVTVCPAAKDQVSRQLLTGSPRLVTFTSAPNPPDHWLVTV